ncbi:outer membrane protein [Oceanicola sp. S124]|uniref:outer membrane protein n=1 Tax=Oceanicola sp. S124 TaxID=1042378 RepID=UPI0002557DF1|nr:outer membrane beta-barrel protein [Oceanicola sp. S124]
MSFLRTLFRKTSLALVAGLGLAGATHAEGWEGSYVSLGLGKSRSQVDWVAGGDIIFALPGYQSSGEDSGLAYGVELGQMMRRGNLLLGWSVGLSSLDHDETIDSPLFAGDTFSTKIGPVFTIAGRVGQDVGDWMFYGETGLALAKLDVPNETPFCPTACRVSLDGVSAGLMAGLGADYRLSDRWSVGVNYRYIGFRDRTATGMVSGMMAPQAYEVGGEASVLTLRLTAALN